MGAVTGTLVLLRHGESEWNKANLFTGWVDVSLSDKGRAEATRGGELLEAEGLLPEEASEQQTVEALHAYLGLAPWSVISCGNGSDALLLALAALELPRGGEVIIATHNYVAAAEAVCHLGLRPVWADVMPSPS